MRRSRYAAMGLLCAWALLAMAGCGGGSSPKKASGPVTVTFWVAWTGKEEQKIKTVVAGFEKLHPDVHVDVVPGVGGNVSHLQPAVVGGNPPDLTNLYDLSGLVKLCKSGGLSDLTARLTAAGISDDLFAAATTKQITSTIGGCGIPQLGDAQGLYYNKTLFARAGITSPPRTLSELAADAIKLTTYNTDGSIKVAGFVPLVNFYSNYANTFASIAGSSWFDASGHADLAKDSTWSEFYTWQRSLIDRIGYGKLNAFAAAAGDPGTAANDFEQGKLAMLLDGEWRTQFIVDDGAKVDYDTAPFPVPDSEPSRYGATAIAPSFLVIPSKAKHPDQAFELATYLSTDTDAVDLTASLFHNIPQLKSALVSPELQLGAHIQPFLDGFANAGSTDTPALAAGGSYTDPLTNFAEKWQSDAVPTGQLHDGLEGVDHQIDTFISQNTPGS